MSKYKNYEYKNYEYKTIKKNNNLKLSCFIINDVERYYKMEIPTNISKTKIIKNILDIKNYPSNTNKFITNILKTDVKNVYAYKIYNELFKNIHKIDIECHFILKQIDENNFKLINNRLSCCYFEDTYYIDINFIHIEIENENKNKESNLITIYINIDSSLSLFDFNNYWEEIEKICINFKNIFLK